MQQYYPNNLDNDPGRMMYSKSEDLLPKKNIFKMIKKNNNNNFNTSTTEQPNLYRENIFSENFNRNDGLGEEVIEKDKKIQELEFKLQQVQHEKESFKSKMELIKQYEKDNNNLSLRLKQEHDKNKDLIIYKNRIDMLEKEKKRDTDIIDELKQKIKEMEGSNDEGITLNIMDKEEHEEDEEGIKELNYDEIYKKTLEEENKKILSNKKYKNDKLKTILSKYLNNLDDIKIDDIFIEMKITEETEITKVLITQIIQKVNR
jgi:hypothetical protein